MKPQSKWGWEHALYFLLGGLGAGAYITGVFVDFAGLGWTPIAKIGVFLGFPCVAIGSIILLADLGKPLNFMHSWKCPGTSWIARGVFILTIFMILGAIHIAFWIWPFGAVLEGAANLRGFIGILGIIFALGVIIYPGFLLGGNRPIAFWSSAMTPLVFLLSALITGVFAVMLIASLRGAASIGPMLALANFALLLIVLQLFALAFYVQGSHRTTESRASAQLLLSGSLAPLFWFGVIVVGLLVPLVLELIAAFALQGAGAGFLHIIAALAAIVGGFCLRQSVISAGVLAPIKAGRFEFALPHI